MSVDHIREKVRQRDGHTCQRCYRKWVPGLRRFDVHHLDLTMEGKSGEAGIYSYDKANMDKLITLCHRCHLRIVHKRPWARRTKPPIPRMTKDEIKELINRRREALNA